MIVIIFPDDKLKLLFAVVKNLCHNRGPPPERDEISSSTTDSFEAFKVRSKK